MSALAPLSQPSGQPAAPAPLCAPTAAAIAAAAASMWGGADADDSEEDGGGENTRAKWSCDALRRKITLFLGTKEVTQTAWLAALHVSPPSFASFMKQKGTWKGTGNGTFWAATRFFTAREARDKAAAAQAAQAAKALPPAERKRKAADDAGARAAKKAAGAALLARIAATPLPDARVLDDCDDVRRACAAFLAEGLCTQAAFLAALDPSGAPVNGNSLGSFLRMKGPSAGAGCKVYPLGYAFFEKRRIAEGRPKSAKRTRAEAEFPHGRSCETERKDLLWFCVPR
jgi:hypothetical protein